MTEEEKRVKIWRLQYKLDKTIKKHNAAVATIEHNIGSKVIVSSYRGDPADRNMAVEKAESEWSHTKGHKYVDITWVLIVFLRLPESLIIPGQKGHGTDAQENRDGRLSQWARDA
jgi:hypothetical protein